MSQDLDLFHDLDDALSPLGDLPDDDFLFEPECLIAVRKASDVEHLRAFTPSSGLQPRRFGNYLLSEKIGEGGGAVPGDPIATYSTSNFLTVNVDPLLSDVPGISFYRYEDYLTGGVPLQSAQSYWMSIVERDRDIRGLEALDAWYWMGAANPTIPEDQYRTIQNGSPTAWASIPSINTWCLLSISRNHE